MVLFLEYKTIINTHTNIKVRYRHYTDMLKCGSQTRGRPMMKASIRMALWCLHSTYSRCDNTHPWCQFVCDTGVATMGYQWVFACSLSIPGVIGELTGCLRISDQNLSSCLGASLDVTHLDEAELREPKWLGISSTCSQTAYYSIEWYLHNHTNTNGITNICNAYC